MQDEQGVRPLEEWMGHLFVIIAAVFLATGSLAAALHAILPEGGAIDLSIVLPTLFQNGLLAWVTLRRLRGFGVGWSDLRPIPESFSQGVRALGWGVALFVLNAVAVQVSAVLLAAVVGFEGVLAMLEREQAVVERILHPEAGPLQVALGVFTAVGVAPVVEELFFRGYAYPVLKRHAGRHAAWMSGLLFAAVHFYVVNFLAIFAAGWVLARLYERSRSLAVPIVAHASLNGIVAAVALAIRGLLPMAD